MSWKCPRCGASHEDTAGAGRLYIAEAARRLGRSATYVKAMIGQGVLRTVAIGGREYIDEQDVDDLAAGRFPSDRHRQEEVNDRALMGALDRRGPMPATPADGQVDLLAAYIARHAPEAR